MNGAAAAEAEGVEVAEVEHSLSLKGNIAVSLCMACLAAVGMGSVLGPGLAAACCAGLAGASSFGWGAYLSRVPPGDD